MANNSVEHDLHHLIRVKIYFLLGFHRSFLLPSHYIHIRLRNPSWEMCCCCCSVAKSCAVLCDSVDSNTPVHHSSSTSLSTTICKCLLKFMSVELVMLFNYLILCHSLLLLLSIFPSIKVFSNESPLLIRWPKY